MARALFDQLGSHMHHHDHRGPSDALVASDITCVDGADRRGGVTVEAGGSLFRSTRRFRVGSSRPTPKRVHLYDTNVRGGVSITGASDSVALVDSTFRGGVTVAANDTGEFATVIAANAINGSLDCADNSPAVVNLGERQHGEGFQVRSVRRALTP